MRNSCIRFCLLGLALSAAAQSAADRSACVGGQGITPQAQSNACTIVLNAGGTKEDRVVAFRNRCWARMLQRDLDGALADCNEALRLAPNDRSNIWTTLYNRANVYDRKRQYDQAIQDYDQLLEIGPKSANLYNSRGNAYRGKGDYKRAIDDYTRSVGLNSNVRNVGSTLEVGTTLANRCETRALAGDLTKALKDCNEAIKLEPNETVPLSSRGFVYLIMGQFDEAFANFDAAVRLSPQRPFALYGRGIAKLRKGDDSGRADIAAAKSLDPDIDNYFARSGIR